MKLSELKALEKSTTIKFEAGELKIMYRPREITPNAVMTDDVIAAFCRIVSSWDLLDDDGNPYPVNREVVGNLPIELLTKVLEAIVSETLPNLKTPGV